MSSGCEIGVRALAPGEEPAAASLDGPAPEGALELWRWRRPLRPGGRRVVVAEIGGRLQATASAVDQSLRLAGEPRPAARLHLAAAPAAPAAALTAAAEALVERLASDGDRDLAFWPAGAGVPGRSISGRLLRLRRPAGRCRHTLRSATIHAELVSDWEPRLDTLAEALAPHYPDGLVRDAGQALNRWAAHPRRRWHRFLLLPRGSRRPAGWLVLGLVGEVCRWEDLLWDHDRPAVLEAASRLASRVALQLGATSEEVWLGGDDGTRRALERLGFTAEPLGGGRGLVGRSLHPGLELAEACYCTAADLDDP